MKTPGTALLGVVFAVFCAGAQITTEGTVTTDSVDILAPVKEQNRASPGLAMAATILVPGLGHQYLGATDRALAYFTTEAFFIVGAVMCQAYSQRLFTNSRGYAGLYANAQGGDGADDRYWQTVGDFLDTRYYNEYQENNRTFEDKYSAQNLQWRWPDQTYMDHYRQARADATRFQIASSFFLGAMVLNRIVSFIDVRAATRHQSIGKRGGVSFRPSVSPDLSVVGCSVVGSF